MRTTIRRMHIVSRPVLQGTPGGLPVATRPVEGEEVGRTFPGKEEFIESWAPRSGEMKYVFMEEIARYPHAGYATGDFLEDADTESEDGDEEMAD